MLGVLAIGAGVAWSGTVVVWKRLIGMHFADPAWTTAPLARHRVCGRSYRERTRDADRSGARL